MHRVSVAESVMYYGLVDSACIVCPSGQEILIDCCMAGTEQQWHCCSMAVSSKCEQCHVVS